RMAGARHARCIPIPSATRTCEESPDRRADYYEFYEQTPASFEFLHTYDRGVATDPRFAEPLNSATGVWFGGGSQNLMAELFLDTEVVPAIHRVLERGGIVAGTCSGAAIVAAAMICGGDDEVE